MLRKILFFACLATVLVASAAGKQLALVRSKNDGAVTSIKLSELAALLKGEHAGSAIIIPDPSSADTQLLLHRVINVSPDQMQAIIKAHPQQIFVANSDEDVLRIVTARKGAVGLIDVYSVTKDVEVLKVEGKLPFEPGYILKGN